jgi:putative DNA primase/helicase
MADDSSLPPDYDEWMNAAVAGIATELPPCLTEDSLAICFANRYRDQLRFDHHHGSWFHWTGHYWRREETKLAFNWAREICREHNTKNKATIAKVSTASGVERFCQADRAFAVTSETWDRDPFLLGTPGGTVDLRTGKLYPARQSDLITRQTAVTPAPPGAKPDLWLRFLSEATDQDEELVLFLRQAAVYSLTGDTREHALFFVYGPGGNGKGTFVNTIAAIMGDYATNAPMETFAVSNHDRHPTDLAMLRGARLVTAQETESGRAWAETRIKALTGGDPITARFMRENFFTFTPIFKLIMSGNHRPVLRNVDDAARRRFNIIPFVHTPAEPDPVLSEKLKPEWPAILRWMIDGCLDWQEHGLIRPQVVVDATSAYFDTQDLFGAWLDEKCKTNGDPAYLYDTVKRLYASWSDYAEAAGDHPGSSHGLGDELEKRGFTREKATHGIRIIRGLALKPEAAE